MTAYRKVSGSWLPGTYFLKVAGSWLQCLVWMKVAGSWLPISGTALSAPVSPDTVEGFGSGTPDEIVISDFATSAPAGGVPPYTYAWTYQSGDASITINSPTSASTTFQKAMSVLSTGGVFRCTVTDGIGQTAYDDVTVGLYN